MFLTVALDRLLARATPRTSPEMSVRSAASIATSVPVPMAIPTSACARAGASLIPSPTIPTFLPSSSCSRFTSATLLPGRTSASTWPTPSWCAMASAVRRLSPVITTTSSPQGAQQLDRLLRLFPYGVGNRDEASRLAVDHNEYRSLPGSGQLLAPRHDPILTNSELREEPPRANEHLVAFHSGLDAASGHSLERIRFHQAESSPPRSLYDGFPQGMLAATFGGGDDPQELLFGKAVGGNNVG